MDTVFEGSEKKCEVILVDGAIDLRGLGDAFWHDVVEACAATVLSTVRNDVCDAYLLSESSLFVWSDHFLLITCGQTKLVEAVLYFLKHVDSNHVAQILFQRKNELYSDLQHSNFADDVERLQQQVDGVQIAFGDKSSHYTELYHLERRYKPAEEDRTYELLMYAIDAESSSYFSQSGLSVLAIRQRLRLNEFLSGWEIDDFVFDPCGYSMNAIQGERYCTIHLTPQDGYSYVSLETNVNLGDIIEIPLTVLKPASFDVVLYQPESLTQIVDSIGTQYCLEQEQRQTIDCGYSVYFAHWKRSVQEEQS